MNIAIIGATGATGLEFVKRALNHGHHVTALVRSPQKIAIQDAKLTVIKGDVLNYADVAQIVREKDAVFLCVGTGEETTKSTIRTDATRQLVKALEVTNAKPLVVVLSTLGAGDSQQQIPFYMRWYFNRKLGNVFADHNVQEQIMRQSTLQHLILRPTYMTHNEATGKVTATTAKDRPRVLTAVSRADVASFALDAIEKGNRHGVLTLTAA